MDSDDSDNRLVAVTSKVSPDLRDQIDAERETNESRSAAIRRLIRDGLEAQEETSLTDRLGFSLVLFLITGFPALAVAYGQTDLAYYFVVMLTLAALLEPQIQRFIRKLEEALP